MVSKELQYGYSKGKAPRLCVKSFSSCFFFLEYRVSAILLRLFSFTADSPPHRTGGISLRVEKNKKRNNE